MRGISKRYDGVNVVDTLDLDIYAGEILAVVGPSGCGKSTLLQMIAGLERPEQGSIIIAGDLVCSVTEDIFITADRRQVALVFQNYALWPHYNVFQNIAYPLQIKGLGKNIIREEVLYFLSLVKLQGLEKRYPHELSGGEQQRVALARALAMKPRLLLLDESLSNLDAKLREEMQGEIKRIQGQLGLTIVHVTHDQNEAMGIADRIAVMNKGKLIQVGTSLEIYNSPDTEFVARFIGSSNLIYSIKEKGNRAWKLDEDNILDDSCICDIPVEATIISVRPQDIVLHPHEGQAWGEISEVTYYGNFINYGLRVGKRVLNVQTTADKHFKPGEKLYFTIRHATPVRADN